MFSHVIITVFSGVFNISNSLNVSNSLSRIHVNSIQFIHDNILFFVLLYLLSPLLYKFSISFQVLP